MNLSGVMDNTTRFDKNTLSAIPSQEPRPFLVQDILKEIEEPYPWEVIGYSFVVSGICLVGVVSNTLSLTVLLRGNLKESHYTYLTVLSASDLTTVWLVFFSGMARGVFKGKLYWRCFDMFVHLPIGAASTSISIFTLMLVTIERLVIIKAPIASMKLCKPTVARQACTANIVFSVLFSIPYCFTFTLTDGRLKESQFSEQQYYRIHNWMRMVVFGFLPGVVLLLGNLLLIHSLQLFTTKSHQIPTPPWASPPPSNSQSGIMTPSLRGHRGKSNHHNEARRLTIVLVGMICSFLVGEFPTHLASRQSATTLLFPGEPHKFHQFSFRVFKLVVTILMCLHYSINFFLYFAFNKRFAGELKRLWKDLGNTRIVNRCCKSRNPPGMANTTPVYNIGGIINNAETGLNTAVIHGSVIVTHSNTINILPNSSILQNAAKKWFPGKNSKGRSKETSQQNSTTSEGSSSNASAKPLTPLFTKRNNNLV